MILIATSWDDGLETDKRLLQILDRHGVKASFSLAVGRHRKNNVPNDVRDVAKYGMLVKSSDLHIYADHDICNHTLTHLEMRMESMYLWRDDITEGKVRLEELYGRAITGMVWPYGVSNPMSRRLARNAGHEFGRTTPGRPWLAHNYCCWDIVPFSWRQSLDSLLGSNHTCIAISGHTYELQTEDDWLYLDNLYRTLSEDTGCQLVTLTELARDIANHESHSCL